MPLILSSLGTSTALSVGPEARGKVAAATDFSHGRRPPPSEATQRFRGDVARNMVRALQRLNGARYVLYVGELGSLRAEHIPNHWLATGCQSVVHNESVAWVNPLELQLEHSPSVAYRVHYSLGSVLDETKDWLLAAEKQYDFVDPEIGQMAKASLEGGTEFGYLHIISDNLARKHIHDLSNERRTVVLQDRKRLVSEIQDIFGRFFDRWSPK